MAIEMISRADASLMNIFGLQGIAETINAFADDAIKDEYLPPFAEGRVTGAMVLTEPDAGSDLQAVSLLLQHLLDLDDLRRLLVHLGDLIPQVIHVLAQDHLGVLSATDHPAEQRAKDHAYAFEHGRPPCGRLVIVTIFCRARARTAPSIIRR
jgi:hypothetical protein